MMLLLCHTKNVWYLLLLAVVLADQVSSQQAADDCCDAHGNPHGTFTGSIYQANIATSYPVVVQYQNKGVEVDYLGGVCGNTRPITPTSVMPGIVTWETNLDYGLNICLHESTVSLTQSVSNPLVWEYFQIRREGDFDDFTSDGTLSFRPYCSNRVCGSTGSSSGGSNNSGGGLPEFDNDNNSFNQGSGGLPTGPPNTEYIYINSSAASSSLLVLPYFLWITVPSIFLCFVFIPLVL